MYNIYADYVDYIFKLFLLYFFIQLSYCFKTLLSQNRSILVILLLIMLLLNILLVLENKVDKHKSICKNCKGKGQVTRE